MIAPSGRIYGRIFATAVEKALLSARVLVISSDLSEIVYTERDGAGGPRKLDKCVSEAPHRHEAFAGNQPYYAVGGCVLLGEHYLSIQQRWRKVRAVVNGSADVPLHASGLEQSGENLLAVSHFFATRGIARVAVAATSKTKFHVNMHTVAPVLGMLKAQIARVAARLPSAPSALALIFESSQRGDPLIIKHFGELQLLTKGQALPTEHCLMPKTAKEPGLEIADFIVNAAGSQARRQLRNIPGFARDYEAVFHKLPSPYAEFFLITEVGGSVDRREAYVQGIGSKRPEEP